VRVLPQFDREPRSRLLQARENAIVTGSDEDEAPGAQPGDILAEHNGKALAPLLPALLRHLVIVDGDPLMAEPVAEMAHGEEEESDPEPMRPDLDRLFLNLRHPHSINGLVETVEGLRLPAELIPEDENKVSHVAPEAGCPSRVGSGGILRETRRRVNR